MLQGKTTKWLHPRDSQTDEGRAEFWKAAYGLVAKNYYLDVDTSKDTYPGTKKIYIRQRKNLFSLIKGNLFVSSYKDASHFQNFSTSN